MCIQTPGSFVWVGSLAGRLGIAGWSTWGIYLVTGVLQGGLLVMAIWFEIRDRRERKSKGFADSGTRGEDEARNGAVAGGAGEGLDDERTALLRNER